MSIRRPRCPRTLPLVAVLAAAAGPALHAATVTSTWVGSASANWSNPANWSPSSAYPNNSNITDYNVTINSVTTPNNNPTADVSASIDALTLNAGANLTINTGITLSLSTTTMINAGNITLKGNSTSGNSTLSLAANGTTLLTGGGTISLTAAYSQISGGSLVNVDNTIAGQGTIASPLVNEGSLYAFHNVKHLWDGGTWDFALLLTAPVDNTNGALILADDGSISVHTTVTGGTLSTSSGSYLVGNGTLSNTTLTATSTLNLPYGFITPSFSGTFTNLGTITNSTGNLSLNNATLSGGGTILLSNSNLSGITGSFTNVDNTIRGQGIIYASVINQAAIRAEGGVLSLSTVNNVGGNLSAAANATLYLNGTVTGGNITLDSGGMLASNGTHGTLQNVTLTSGSNCTPSGGALTLAGTFTNHGIVAIYGTLIFAPGATTLLNGGGTITLKSMSNISGGNFTNVDNTIQGTGTISANITNQASIIASGGNLTLAGSVDNSNGTITTAANGTLLVNATLTGGTISLTPGAQIGGNGTISSASLSGTATIIGTATTIGTPQLNNITLTSLSTLTIQTNASPQFAGTFTNHGTVTIGNGTLTLPSNTTTTFTGGGTVTLASTSARVSYGNLLNLDNTIQGFGTINANLTNQATIIASGGTLSLSGHVTGTGNATVTPTSTLNAWNFTQSSLANDGTFIMSGNGTLGLITGNGTLTSNSIYYSVLRLLATANGNANHQSDITTTGTHALDLTNNSFVIDSASKSTTFSKLKSELSNASIYSSTLPTHYAVALLDNAITKFSTFGNLTVTSNSILISPELLGDANIDGHIDLSDLATILNHFGKTSPNWTDGNFDNAAAIDQADLNYVLNNFGLTNPNPSAQSSALSPQSSVPTPEPASLSVLALSGLLLLKRPRS